MKVAMLVEDRDSGYLFLDPTQAPDEAEEFEFTLGPGVIWDDIQDDSKVVWMATDNTIRVVLRSMPPQFPDDQEWPIPSCGICLAEADYWEMYRR
jgi:hypothetical protein